MTAKPRLVEREEPGPGAEEALARRRSRRGALLLGTLVVALLAGLGGYGLLTRGQETTDNAQVEADVVPLSARVGGQVLHVRVEDNSRVKEGDVLVELEPSEYALRVAQAEAELASARAQATVAEVQVTLAEAQARGTHSSASARVSASTAAQSNAEAQVDVARAALIRAEVEANRAALELERVRRLRAQEVSPQQELDDALAASEATQAELAGARAQLVAAEQARQAARSRVAEARGQLDESAPVEEKISVARANSALAQARVKAAETALEQARLMLAHTRLLAPAEGLVSRLSVHEGQLLSPGQPVARLVPTRTYVIANFKETQVGRIRPGQRVEVTVDAFPSRTLQGRVESLSGGTGARFSLLPPDNAS
ncbi:MAG TPA: HlyD family secretion protein, partial [Myxococcaceae bacterium]|nr:HlyD family secretion protein [Myxococcaceae bacterium]